MRARFGHNRCGLQTGDTSLNTEADIVIMTTEILRNIMYRTAEGEDAAKVWGERGCVRHACHQVPAQCRVVTNKKVAKLRDSSSNDNLDVWFASTLQTHKELGFWPI